jgi:hypothetical protein
VADDVAERAALSDDEAAALAELRTAAEKNRRETHGSVAVG